MKNNVPFDAPASHPGAELARFASGLSFDQIPDTVRRRAEDLFVDWVGSAIAGHGSRPVESIVRFAQAMGPGNGSCEVLVDRSKTSPFSAAMANAAASHVAEQDDVHNGSVFHPATVVFPAALATAQHIGASGQDFLTAVVAGYEVGIRVGEFLGRSHYKVFHTTGTAGTFAAAAATGQLLGLDAAQMGHAFGSAGTQSSGLWEFLRTAADSKQLHTAHSASAGLMSAWLAKDGFTGAERIFDGAQGIAAGMTDDANPSRLADGLGTRWTLAETSFKFHASCRHTHPAADALAIVMRDNRLQPVDIERIVTHVHQGAIDVLGLVERPQTVHQSKFSMGTVLALVALHAQAGLPEFECHFQDADVAALRDRVEMRLDEEVDLAYPARWIGKVTVHTRDGRELKGRIDEPKGDPGNTLTREELAAKARRLAAFSGGAEDGEMKELIERLWTVASWPRVESLLGAHRAR